MDVNVIARPPVYEMRCASCGGRAFKAWAKKDLDRAQLYGLECGNCGRKYRMDDKSGFEGSTTLRVKGVNDDGYR